MMDQFVSIRTCRWNDCYYQFTQAKRTCGSYLKHITDHLEANKAHQCLWNDCNQILESQEELATHISEEHDIPNSWTTHTSMHYCYEHDVWCHSNQMWDAHLHFQHLQRLNDFCGLLKERGVVVVAAHCLFCLGDTKPLSVRFAQYHDVFDLHKHMTGHLAKSGTPKACPHPICKDTLGSESDFWDHATSVHGIPSFGPRRITGKRKRPEDGDNNKVRKGLKVA
ncbi:hypothetical protein BU25DRAFT_102344 [Macroventuria anomochaeta]|uniref:Uncharacterized protein n=1 Tax=Macroventuria anomochaeta TaxID=301207 RepID=A0ACB6RYY7_9PLEO|nr:uncharacterized protein BU25DRAFT_102344 [Macroventuria anomochaeta]KAF2626154.1 hypothetical protein BU25DRAFT_102344 [Macroventuria anomochaeta]